MKSVTEQFFKILEPKLNFYMAVKLFGVMKKWAWRYVMLTFL